jgi:cation transport regulator ChaC
MFVEFDEPRQSVAHHDPTILLGVVRKMWVPCPDWRAVTDSDGVRSGIEYAGL